MTIISENEALAAFCARHSAVSYVTVDTEFMRDKTYWPQLCLVQIGGPDEAVAIDTLMPGLDLSPLIELMANPDVLKVFHAARQDIEIFYHLSGAIPAPLFDTQVAAMVCGFGDSVSYETLAGKLAGARIDKSSRFTDWSTRPLTERQTQYALADVTHLRRAYEKLVANLERTGRAEWLAEEMAALTNPSLYRLEPVEAWRRLRPRGGSRRFLAVLREIAAWREQTAQQRNLPRNRVIKDESLLEIAAHLPRTVDDLARTRGLNRSIADGRFGADLLAAVERALALPESEQPTLLEKHEPAQGIGPLVDLLRVLLKLRCEENAVAQRLVADAEDLEAIATSDDASVPALSGWRYEVFGRDAIDLKHGRTGLTAAGKRIRLVHLDQSAQPVAKTARLG